MLPDADFAVAVWIAAVIAGDEAMRGAGVVADLTIVVVCVSISGFEYGI